MAHALDFLPLRPRVFHLLLALRDSPQHGYGLKKLIRERTAGALDLDPGGMYRLIARLEGDGLVTPQEPAGPDGADPRRRYYGLTDLGRNVLRAEARRLSDVASWADVAELAREGSQG